MSGPAKIPQASPRPSAKASPEVEEPEVESSAPLVRAEEDTGKAKKKAAPKTTAKARMGRPPTAALAKLEDDLVVTFSEIGAGVGIFAPLTGYVWTSRAPLRAKCWCSLAAKDPRIQRGLEKFVETGAITLVLGDLAAVGLAAAVEFGAIDVDSMPSRSLGIDKAWIEVYGELPERSEGRSNESIGNPDERPTSGVMGDIQGAA